MTAATTAEPPRLLLLTGHDAAPGPHHRLLRLFGHVETRALSALPAGATAVTGADIVVTSGLSLNDDDIFRRLDAVLRVHRLPSVPLLCLLDRATRRDVTRARMLGTAALLSAAAGADAVLAALKRLSVSLPAGSSADAVAAALADTMVRAAAGTGIDRAACAAAAGAVANALNEDGVDRWMRLVATVHDPTYRHCLLVSGLVSGFAAHLRHHPAEIALLTEAAILHDLGKALVPLSVIDKPGPLDPDEVALMRRHPVDGHALLLAQGGHDPLILDVVRSHHEYLDGSGYPDRLFRHQIPDAVRIATICDVFAALVEERAYKPALSAAAACDALRDMGGKLDQRFVIAFRRFLGPILAPAPAPAPALAAFAVRRTP